MHADMIATKMCIQCGTYLP